MGRLATAVRVAWATAMRPLEVLGTTGARLAATFWPSALGDAPLFRFDSLADIGKFEVATDRAIGGMTVCSFGVKDTRDGVIGVFEGVLRNDDELFKSTDGRTATYASFRTKVQHPLPDLAPFSGLQFQVKTDGRPYVVLLTTRSHAYEAHLDEAQALNAVDTWQCELCVPGGRWVTATAPFDSFLRVDRGHVTVSQRPREEDELGPQFRGPDPSTLQSLSVVLADGVKGEFRMCLRGIRAVRYHSHADSTLMLPPGGRMSRRKQRGLASHRRQSQSGQPSVGAPARRLEGPAADDDSYDPRA
ncbi:hypothetical protein FNF29_07037 [Cafeteria roenbergensis]|uniref:NADH:ubiquinone oxidoreductase intermediate-associated protein 30 domain-containing protein n=1 Tax=Cafeteria roenbergensis TaxID=33653 RepID=A0A5A8C4Z5_CAFRO|nr:hypothetical protein FNF29_07037 [Cafeteria roenbergensis]|eukprot:KAA0147948.1 hypothetical protein FNF29_07037 [Cafeteria roenbergensis]